MMDAETRDVLLHWHQTVQTELDKVVQFWMKYSHDIEYGGFFTCLDRDGTVFDETKYIWLQSRQVWVYARLYNEVPRFATEEILKPAIKGADFLLDNCIVDCGGYKRCAFATTRDGKPIKIQRTIFSECFFVMAMSEIWKTTKEYKYKDAALSIMKQIQHWCMNDDKQLGREALSGCVPVSTLAVAMMAFCLCKQMNEVALAWTENNDLEKWAVDEMLLHIQRKGTRILENVSQSGEELPGANGRLQIPGHAIECGWFLLEHAMNTGDDVLAQKAIKCFIDGPYKQGWDNVHGGLLYFIDADGFPPTQLEWNMKLWWPHNEAMIAFLMAFQHTGDRQYVELFDTVSKYAFSKFSDPVHGEWFGYLSQNGDMSSRFKGSPWKGFFHIPRCLYLCEKIIVQLMK